MTIREIADQFQLVDPQDRLEILLDYSERLPPLPEEYAPLRDRGVNMVHECQSPVFLMVEVDDGEVVHLHADVPREAPTARSFTSILLEAFDGQPAAVVLDAPPDVLHDLGIDALIGMQRTRGLRAIYAKLRHEVAQKAGAGGNGSVGARESG